MLKPGAWCSLVCVLGCGSSSSKPAGPPPPLTIATLMQAEEIEPNGGLGRPVAQVVPRLQARLGPPTTTDGDEVRWAVRDGDTCAAFWLVIAREPTGDVVDGEMPPRRYAKTDPDRDWLACLRAVGAVAVPPEDEAAPAPPPAGARVALAAFQRDAVAGRTRWRGQRIAVTGRLAEVTTSTSTTSTDVRVTVMLKGDGDEPWLYCELPANRPAPTEADQVAGAPIVATGTVAIRSSEALTPDRDRVAVTFTAALEDCTVEFGPR